MLQKFLFICAFSILLQACSTTHHYSIKSYKYTTDEIKKTYKLDRPDLILSYDLAKVNDNNCIYSKTLGLIANEKVYAEQYLNKFKTKFKSKSSLIKEAKNKIFKICDLLIYLHNKHKILSSKNEQYVRRLLKSKLTDFDARTELSKLDHITSHIPIMLPGYKFVITSDYGNRMHPIYRKSIFHCGTDLAASHHAPIYASAVGRVSFVGTINGYGKIVEIIHNNGIKTKYAHLSVIFVSKGQKVIRGQIVGLQGKTGNAKGEHLHFEIHIAGKHVNPRDFIGYNLGS